MILKTPKSLRTISKDPKLWETLLTLNLSQVTKAEKKQGLNTSEDLVRAPRLLGEDSTKV